jgi:GSH-dependent disulfide-bond oxidoreductase
MIDLYFFPTPNGQKVSIALEELGLPYTTHVVHIGRGEQFTPAFLKISPNNRIPAIVDRAPADGGEPISIFESGAILEYLADKTGQLLPKDARARTEVLQWVYWQVGGQGPMMGQANHFRNYAPEKVAYGIDRYTKESNRLYGVLDQRLEGREFIAGNALSIADIICFPWTLGFERVGHDMASTPNVKRWQEALGARPAFQRGMALGAEHRTKGLDDEAKKVLFNQTADSVKPKG